MIVRAFCQIKDEIIKGNQIYQCHTIVVSSIKVLDIENHAIALLKLFLIHHMKDTVLLNSLLCYIAKL